MSERPRPKAQNGFLLLGSWDDEVEAKVRQRWPYAVCSNLAEGLARVDLSRSERGLCPGFNDEAGLREISSFHPGSVAMGFFCDSIGGAEGVRVFVDGRQLNRQHLEWAQAEFPDPIVWPIGKLAMSVSLPIEVITQVERPGRPPLSLAIEALLRGEVPEEPQSMHQALELLGELDGEPVADALVKQLDSQDWVARYHAARSYARRLRGQGQEGRPPLTALLDDEDEGVREAALEGIAELIALVEFSDRELQAQIDAAIQQGLADEDEDVRAAADKAQGLRKQLLG